MLPSDEEELALRHSRILARGRLALILRGGQSRDGRSAGASAESNFQIRFRADQSLGHLAESVGIPRLEIESALSTAAHGRSSFPRPTLRS